MPDPKPLPSSKEIRFGTPVSFEDFQAITSAVFTFAYALDMRDWDLMRTVFAEKVMIDTSSATGRSSQVQAAESFIWDVKISETGFEGTELLFGNCQVAIDAGTAYLRVAFYGEHVAAVADGDNFYTIGGYQEWRLQRDGNTWKIDGFRLLPTWTKGNREVMNVGVRRGAERLRARGDSPPAGIVERHKW